MSNNTVDNAILNRITSNIQSEDRRKRKEALEDVYTLLFESINLNADVWEKNGTEIQKNVLKCLYDKSEAVRDSSITVINELINKVDLKEDFISEFIAILLWRLGDKEVNEQSEEIRLRLVTLLDDLISNAKEKIAPYAENIVQILARTLTDNYPKVRQKSCQCASNLASTVPRNFYNESNKLVKPILVSFNHQHFRMRVAAIEALGKVVRYGNTKNLAVQDVFGSLAERLFDSNPTVRSSVAKVIGDWLINMYDRYSFFTKMIPLILTCLCDELPELRQEAWEIWSRAGLQYEQENEQELKDKIDFLYEKPEHYPENVLRPNLGCRTLVQRNTCQITPALSRELEDWKNDIRIKSAQLLCWLVLHAESDITQHTENLLTTMYKSCNQTDSRIVENVEKAAEYIGYFVLPDTYMHLVLQVIEDVCTSGHLCVLSALMRGAKSELLDPHVHSITKVLSADEICRNRDVVYQLQLLKCCEALLKSNTKMCSENANYLFITIVTVVAIAGNEQISHYAKDLLDQLSKTCGLHDCVKLYEEFSEILLKKMHLTVETWTSVSFDQHIMLHILEEGDAAVGVHLKDIMAILKTALRVEADPIVKSKIFSSLSVVIIRKNLTMASASEETYHHFVKSLINDCICPNLVWHAGRSAEALRTVVLACLSAALLSENDRRDILNVFGQEDSVEEFRILDQFPSDTVEEIFNSLFSLLLNTIEDCAVKSRLFSIKVLQNLMEITGNRGVLTPDHVNQTYPVLLKRLDDVSNEVRKCAVTMLKVLYSNLPKSYNSQGFQPHLESLFTTMLIHLDDPDPSFQELMTGTLKTIGKISPKVLHDKLRDMKNRFRNYTMCDDILVYLKECQERN